MTTTPQPPVRRDSLDALFWPRAVAVIGASPREHAIGHSIVANLQAFGYRGPVHPVNPNAKPILGLPVAH